MKRFSKKASELNSIWLKKTQEILKLPINRSSKRMQSGTAAKDVSNPVTSYCVVNSIILSCFETLIPVQPPVQAQVRLRTPVQEFLRQRLCWTLRVLLLSQVQGLKRLCLARC